MGYVPVTKSEALLVEQIVRAVLTRSTQEAADAIADYRNWVRADERERVSRVPWTTIEGYDFILRDEALQRGAWAPSTDGKTQ